MSIRAKLLSLILLISVLPVLIIGYFNYSNFKDVIERQTQHNLEVVAQGKQHEVELYLSALKARVQDFASDGFIRDSLQRFQSVHARETIIATIKQHLLDNKVPLDAQIIAIDLLDLNDVVVISTDYNRLGIEYSAFANSRKSVDGVIYSDLFMDEHIDVLAMEVLIEGFSRTHKEKKIGSFLIRFDVSKLNQLMSLQQFKEVKHADLIDGRLNTDETYLVNNEHLMLTQSRFIDKGPFSIVVDSSPVDACLVEGRGMSGYWLDYRGVEVIGSSICMEVADFRWVLISEVDVSDALALINDYQRLFGMAIFVVLLVILVVSLYISRVVSAPIRTLKCRGKRNYRR